MAVVVVDGGCCPKSKRCLVSGAAAGQGFKQARFGRLEGREYRVQ